METYPGNITKLRSKFGDNRTVVTECKTHWEAPRVMGIMEDDEGS